MAFTMTQLKEVAVATKRWILFLLPAAMISALAGCGGSTFNVQNPPPPPPSNLSIAFQPAPPGSILINAATDLTAAVSNDPSNAGVDWSLTCSNTGNCGTLSSLHTNSGTPTTYTPPSALPGNILPINIVAFATADHTKNALATISVTAFGSTLSGTYVLQAQGVDSSFNLPYQFAGVITLDGSGGITSGEQTVNFFDPNVNGGALVSKSDSVSPTGSSYFLGPDGRGTITINTNDQDLGQGGIETFGFVSLSSSHALIAQIPPSLTAGSFASTSGTMDLQTWTSNSPPLSGGYAFVVSGSDFSSGLPTAIGGILNINSPNNISGTGSTADQMLPGFGSAPINAKLSGSISNPDSFGAVTLRLNVPNFLSTQAFTFTGYIVDATHIMLIESDNANPASLGLGSTAGVALGQGNATGTLASFSGTYVFGVLGEDLAVSLPSTLTSVGVFTAVDNGDGTGNLTNGYTDTFLQAYSNPVTGSAGDQISGTFSGQYSEGTSGVGRVRSFPSKFSPTPGGGFRPEFIFYQTGNGNPALIIATANNNLGVAGGGALFVGRGIAYPQSAAPLTFGGKYGLSITQQNGSENDDSGQMTADPTAQTLAGSLDFYKFDDPTFTGAFASPDPNGRFAGILSGVLSGIEVEYYVIDPGRGFFVETDLVNPNATTNGQVSFGYYAARTPVCDGCP
jgi:hypothetical protein